MLPTSFLCNLHITGQYYLVDAGYTNGVGFLAPYRGRRYHLSEWRQGALPTNHEEFFNKRHAQAPNVIERYFGVLKMRWAILRSPSFFSIHTQYRIITACSLLHNLIRREMSSDPLESEIDNSPVDETPSSHPPHQNSDEDYIDGVKTSPQ